MNEIGPIRFGYRFFAFHTFLGAMGFAITIGGTYLLLHLCQFLPEVFGFFVMIAVPVILCWTITWMFLFRIPISARFDLAAGKLIIRTPLERNRAVPFASFVTWKRRSHPHSYSTVLYCSGGGHVILPAYILDHRIYSTLRKARIRYDGYEKRLLFFFLPSKCALK